MNTVTFVCFIPNKACANQCAECEYLMGLARQRATSDTKQDTPVSGVVCGADSKLTVTFEYWPIESAPKDRELMIYDPCTGWSKGEWRFSSPRWVDDACPGWYSPLIGYKFSPTHWAEVASMAPAEENR